MYRLRLFGEPLLLDESDVGRPLWRPQVGVLAYLALTRGHCATRGVLARLLWADVPESTARSSLRQILFRFRRDVGEILVGQGDSLRIDRSVIDIDVARFEELLDASQPGLALDLYEGPLLGDFQLGSPELERWLDGYRLRLARRAADACAALSDPSRAADDESAMLRWAERWTELDALSEAAWARLIALRARGGDRTGALEAYGSFRERLVEELGVEPGPELRDLVARIRKSTPPAPPPAPSEHRQHAPAAEPPLVGRTAELRRLHLRWDAARAVRRQAVVLTGDGGIGKTRLAREFAKWLELEGATVLWVRAYELERGVPFATLAGLLRGALDAPGLSAVDTGSIAELGRILPEILERFRGSVSQPAAGDFEAGRLRLHRAFRVLVENLAFEAPVLVVVDDLPCTDSATLATLNHLWQELRSSPVLLLFTVRENEIGAGDAISLLKEIQRDADEVETIQLGPLGEEELHRLAAAIGLPASGRTTDERVGERLSRETGGNVLFAIETVRAWREGSSPERSPTVRARISERTERLSPPARELLRAAAVLRRRFPLPLAASVANLDAAPAIDALEELVGRGLLQQTGFEYDFVHEILRNAVHAELLPERLRLLHLRAYLRQQPQGQEAIGLERASRLAAHAIGSGRNEDAHGWLLRAADLARERFAGAEAERYLEEAIELASTDSQRGAALERLGDIRFSRSRFTSAAMAYHRAVAAAAPGSSDRLRRRIRLLDAAQRAELVEDEEAAEACVTLLADAASAGHSFHRDALTVVASGQLRRGRLGDAQRYATAAVEAAIRAGEAAPLVRARLLASTIAVRRGAADAAIVSLEEAVRVATDHELILEQQDACTDLATERCRLGQWDEALTLWRRIISSGRESGAHGAVAVAHLNTADVLLRRGEFDRAAAHLDEAAVLSSAYGFPHVAAEVEVNRALLAHDQGRTQGLLEAAERAVLAAASAGLPSVERTARALLALGFLQTGDLTSARDNVSRLSVLPADRHPTWSDDREVCAVARARLGIAELRASDAVALLEQELHDVQDPYGRAVLLVELAGLRRHSNSSAARSAAREAAAIATRLGARPLLARALSIDQEPVPA